MLGDMLFMDKSGKWLSVMHLQFFSPISNGNNFSWGSAALSWLDRHLCNVSEKIAKQIGGALLLMQLWAWANFPQICPVMRHPHQALPPGPLSVRWKGAKCIIEHQTHVLRTYRMPPALLRQNQLKILCKPSFEIYTDCIDALKAVEVSGRLTLDDARVATNTSDPAAGCGQRASGRRGHGGRQSAQRHTSGWSQTPSPSMVHNDTYPPTSSTTSPLPTTHTSPPPTTSTAPADVHGRDEMRFMPSPAVVPLSLCIPSSSRQRHPPPTRGFTH
ncbi:protein main-like 2 [Quercus suber]|uniref:Protein main-like 2 n=1 Tax=Quercus suber TaxID=58331 RepID=A0AAW0JW56_QUESU